MNYLWKLNRWYDDLDKTNPTMRFVYFIGLIVVCYIPSLILVELGYIHGDFVSVLPTLLLIPFGIIRFIWLRKNNAL